MNAISETIPSTLRVDNVRLGILYMVASVFLFSIQNVIGKWLAQSYPIPMLVFFRSFVALLPSFLLVMRAGGLGVKRTNRLGGQFGRAVIWGGSDVASFFGYHLRSPAARSWLSQGVLSTENAAGEATMMVPCPSAARFLLIHMRNPR